MRRGYVYLLASYKGGTIYTGMTSDLPSRLHDHQMKIDPKCFTAVHDATRLVWFDDYELIVDAIQREKTMKGWPRQWKINLIELTNPEWLPLHPVTGEFQRI